MDLKNSNLSRTPGQFTMLLWAIGWVIVFWTSIAPNILFSQRVVAKVTVTLKQLPEIKQTELKDFYQVVENYINTFDWVEDDQGGAINVSMQFVLSDISVSGESRYRANLLVTNERDIQYFDKRCKFAYQQNEQIAHHSNQINSLTTLLDYYIYLILGHEFDKFSRFGGTPYFKLAQQRAEQGRFGLGQFVEGWDLREQEISKILSEELKPYRVMLDVFFYGTYLFYDKGEKDKGRTYIYEALKMIETELPKTATSENFKKFLSAYSTELIQIFKDARNSSEVFKLLTSLDPEHKSTYEQYLRD